MHVETHQIKGLKIAEVRCDGLILKSTEDGLDLLGDLYYQGFDKVMLHSRNITPAFFDLKNGMAGEILQKFSNYRIPLAIIGDFSSYSSPSVKGFIRESNAMGHVHFVPSRAVALDLLSKP